MAVMWNIVEFTCILKLSGKMSGATLCDTFFIFSFSTLSIRIVADCVALSCQVTRKLKRDTTLEFATVSAIIFIHRYQLFFNLFANLFSVSLLWLDMLCLSFYFFLQF